MRLFLVVVEHYARGAGEGVFPNPADLAEPAGEQPLPEELNGGDRQGGMELVLAEVNRGSSFFVSVPELVEACGSG